MRVLLLTLTVACQTKPKTEATTDNVDSVAADSGRIDLTKKPSPDAPRSAADRLVRALYFEHDKKESPFMKAADRSLVDQYFTAKTGTDIWERAQKTVKRPPVNPLYNVPDASVKKMWVLPATISGDKAVVFVTFNQNNVPKEMRCELEQQPNGRWRIADILYDNGTRLTETLN